MAIQALLVILAVLLVLLFLGVPISYAIAVSSLTAILSSIDLNVAVLTAAQRTFVGMSKFSLTAIPFFILAGNIMNQGGIAKRLVDFVMAILGKMPGALLVTNIGTNALFGAISGSASAAAAAVGSMIRDGAEEQGYDPAVTAATNAASSCSGLLIPPSNALITYSLASGGTSVAALFMAGYIPGIIWALCCCVVGVLLAVKLGYKGTPGKFDWKNLGICTLRALPSLSLIIVVIGGIGSVTGSCIGSFLFVACSEWWLRFLDQKQMIGEWEVPLLRNGFRLVVFSLIIMVVVLFFRQGIMGSRELPDLFRKRAAAKAAGKGAGK